MFEHLLLPCNSYVEATDLAENLILPFAIWLGNWLTHSHTRLYFGTTVCLLKSFLKTDGQWQDFSLEVGSCGSSLLYKCDYLTNFFQKGHQRCFGCTNGVLEGWDEENAVDWALHSLGEHQLPSPEAVPADSLGGSHGPGGVWASALVAVLFQPTNQPKQTSTNLPKKPHTPPNRQAMKKKPKEKEK